MSSVHDGTGSMGAALVGTTLVGAVLVVGVVLVAGAVLVVGATLMVGATLVVGVVLVVGAVLLAGAVLVVGATLIPLVGGAFVVGGALVPLVSGALVGTVDSGGVLVVMVLLLGVPLVELLVSTLLAVGTVAVRVGLSTYHVPSVCRVQFTDSFP